MHVAETFEHEKNYLKATSMCKVVPWRSEGDEPGQSTPSGGKLGERVRIGFVSTDVSVALQRSSEDDSVESTVEKNYGDVLADALCRLRSAAGGDPRLACESSRWSKRGVTERNPWKGCFQSCEFLLQKSTSYTEIVRFTLEFWTKATGIATHGWEVEVHSS